MGPARELQRLDQPPQPIPAHTVLARLLPAYEYNDVYIIPERAMNYSLASPIPDGLVTLDADPGPLNFRPDRAALLLIDMQRDFLEPGGFGSSLGNDVSRLRAAIGPCQRILKCARQAGLTVIHTREGHRPDLSDALPAKRERGAPSLRIGDPGPMGRILIRGEAGHDIIPELRPLAGEAVIDKPGKGAFYQTDLELILARRHTEVLFVCGVTTEVCVHTTIREANDRGYRCVALGDACASYFPEFHAAGLAMISAQGGIFGWVSDTSRLNTALEILLSRSTHERPLPC